MMVGCILFDVLFENIVFVCKRHITGEGCNIKAFDFQKKGFGIGPRSLFFVVYFGITTPPPLRRHVRYAKGTGELS